jgi:hypothetical protein
MKYNNCTGGGWAPLAISNSGFACSRTWFIEALKANTMGLSASRFLLSLMVIFRPSRVTICTQQQQGSGGE